VSSFFFFVLFFFSNLLSSFYDLSIPNSIQVIIISEKRKRVSYIIDLLLHTRRRYYLIINKLVGKYKTASFVFNKDLFLIRYLLLVSFHTFYLVGSTQN
jgi:hypothetical protein